MLSKGARFVQTLGLPQLCSIGCPTQIARMKEVTSVERTLLSRHSRPSRFPVSFFAKATVVVVLIMGVLTGIALAQTNWFNIWAYNTDMWTGTADNYHYYPNCVGTCNYDYMIPMNAEVRQDSPGSFSWEIFEIAAGNVFYPPGCCAYAWKGHLWVWTDGITPTLVADSSTFECDEVRTYGSLVVGTLGSGTRVGHWDQDSGAGGTNCFTSYDEVDKWVVTGQ